MLLSLLHETYYLVSSQYSTGLCSCDRDFADVDKGDVLCFLHVSTFVSIGDDYWAHVKLIAAILTASSE